MVYLALLREHSAELTLPVYHLFLCISNACTYPDAWKISEVTPVYKKGDKSEIQSYRPISILSKLSLVFERIIYKNIYPFILKRLSHRQYGFVKKRSCEIQLLAYLHDIYINLDKNIPVYAFYLDFCKAFDRVPHNVLLQQLRDMGIGGDILRLIASYFTQRKQIVKINNTRSEECEVISGVPQGSILGAIFFVAFINNMCDACQNSIMFLFADDSKARSASILGLQRDLNACCEWASKHGMTFNSSKTVFMVFSSTPEEHASSSILVNGLQIHPSNCIKDLGVFVSSNLKWSTHISEKIRCCYAMFYNLRRSIPSNTPIKTKLQLIKSFVLSILSYCCSVWHPNARDLQKCEILLSRVTKWISSEKDYSKRMQICGLLPIGLYLNYRDLVLLNSLLLEKYDFPIFDYVSMVYQNYPLRNFQKPVFCITKCDEVRTENCFFLRVVKLANKLHQNSNLSVFDPPTSFKHQLLKHFQLIHKNTYKTSYL